MEQLLAKLFEEAGVIKQAPLSFAFVWGLGLLIIYLMVRRSFQARLADFRGWLADRDNVIAFLEKRQGLTGAGTPTDEKKKDLSSPVIELMHFDFEDVIQDESGFYFKVAKGQGLKAAILDFSLKPVSGAVPWTCGVLRRSCASFRLVRLGLTAKHAQTEELMKDRRRIDKAHAQKDAPTLDSGYYCILSF